MANEVAKAVNALVVLQVGNRVSVAILLSGNSEIP
jgi:hypothetical protein